jgi:hypothetical protein
MTTMMRAAAFLADAGDAPLLLPTGEPDRQISLPPT